jgi:hypothetical protein
VRTNTDAQVTGAGAAPAEAAGPAPRLRAAAQGGWPDVGRPRGCLPPALMLVAWAPARLDREEPAALRAVRAHLRDIQNHVAVNEMEVGVWEPDQRVLEQIAWQLRFDPQAVTAAAIRAEIEGNVWNLMFDRPVPPASYLEAEEQLRRALRRQARGLCDREDVQRARDDLHDCLEREVIRPLWQPTGSPAKRNVQLALMLVSRLFHQAALATEVSLTLPSGATRRGGDELIPGAQLRQLTTLSQTIIALTKGLCS